jgi:nucleoside-diphosphate-sugar epimerase
MQMPQADNVVIIGGAGFIGSHLTSQLRDAGNHVTVVSRSAGLGRREEPGLRYFRAGVAEPERIQSAIEGASVVYHLAMGGGATWADYQRDFIDGALNIARACQKHGVRRLLFTSSISALCMSRPGKLYDSPQADTRVRSRGFYGRGKIEAERVLLKLHRTENLPVVILRPAIVLGSGGMLAHGALGHAASDTCILGWGEGNNPLPCVLVQDVAKALVLAKDAPDIEGKGFNLSGDIRPTAKEFVALLRERTLRNFRFYPRSLSQMAALEWIMWGIKTAARSPNNVRTSYADLQNLTMAADLDCSLAKQLLGWNPVADREVFLREAIDSHLKPFKPGDLRLDQHALADA